MVQSVSRIPVEATCTKCGHKARQTFSQFNKAPLVKCPLCAGPMQSDLSAIKERVQRNVNEAEKLVRDIKRMAQED